MRRARFRCPVDGRFYYPLDDVLDLPEGEVTASLGKWALRLATHMGFSDYVEYRQRGFVIGSGMMESTCEQLVGWRLKGSGRQWSEQGALAMTALIGHRLNRTWDAFWRSRSLQRAA